MIMSGAVALS